MGTKSNGSLHRGCAPFFWNPKDQTIASAGKHMPPCGVWAECAAVQHLVIIAFAAVSAEVHSKPSLPPSPCSRKRRRQCACLNRARQAHGDEQNTIPEVGKLRHACKRPQTVGGEGAAAHVNWCAPQMSLACKTCAARKAIQ